MYAQWTLAEHSLMVPKAPCWKANNAKKKGY